MVSNHPAGGEVDCCLLTLFAQRSVNLFLMIGPHPLSSLQHRFLKKGTNIVKEYKDIFSNTSGSDLKTDLITDDKIEALSLLQKLVEQKKASIKKEDKRKKWEFPTSPHEDFGKSLDDTYAAFLAWARVKQDESKINVSKAFRRLETYAVC